MKKLFYIFYLPLLLVEWAVDLFHKIWTAFHESVKDITLALENYINEPTGKKPDKKGL